MAKNIVFLNMSDDLGVDGHKAVTALQLKYPNAYSEKNIKKIKLKGIPQVTEVNMVEFYREFATGQHSPNFNKTRSAIKKLCEEASEVMLSIHGPMDSTEYGLIRSVEANKNDEKVTVMHLAQLLLVLFLPSVNYNFSLIMCFGARTSNYRYDHQNLNLIDWTDSFAYKLFNSISPRRKIRMTARTGELSFNPVTGKSEVQTELAIQGTLDNKSIGEEQAVIQSLVWWSANLQRLLKGSKEVQDFVLALETARRQAKPLEVLTELRKLNINHGLTAEEADRVRLIDYLGHTIRLTEASTRQSDPVRGKYGKLVFSHTAQLGNFIIAKYPNPMLVHPKTNGNATNINNDLMRKLNK